MSLPQIPYRFRVFVSYAHADKAMIESMIRLLESIGLNPLWDKYITPGSRFTDEIKELISRAHLFIPVITKNSNDRPWVHQETGFAIALNIPILPICIGHVPSEMIAETQGITVCEDLSDLVEQLTAINFVELVTPKPLKPFGLMDVAEGAESRAASIARYTNWVTDLGEYAVIRAQARFTGFSIPDRDVEDGIWDAREGDAQLSPDRRRLEREERKALERHARKAGCKLIIDPAATTFDVQGSHARRARLSVLLEFLKQMPPDKLEVVMSMRAQDTNLLIVGDYFMAESMAARPGGYVHTVFNAHPPSVLRRIQRFDQLFSELQSQNPASLAQVIQTIEGLLEKA